MKRGERKPPASQEHRLNLRRGVSPNRHNLSNKCHNNGESTFIFDQGPRDKKSGISVGSLNDVLRFTNFCFLFFERKLHKVELLHVDKLKIFQCGLLSNVEHFPQKTKKNKLEHTLNSSADYKDFSSPERHAHTWPNNSSQACVSERR